MFYNWSIQNTPSEQQSRGTKAALENWCTIVRHFFASELGYQQKFLLKRFISLPIGLQNLSQTRSKFKEGVYNTCFTTAQIHLLNSREQLQPWKIGTNGRNFFVSRVGRPSKLITISLSKLMWIHWNQALTHGHKAAKLLNYWLET